MPPPTGALLQSGHALVKPSEIQASLFPEEPFMLTDGRWAQLQQSPNPPLRFSENRNAQTQALDSLFCKLVAFFKYPLKFLTEVWKCRAVEAQLAVFLKSASPIDNIDFIHLFYNLSSLSEGAVVEKKEFYRHRLTQFSEHLSQIAQNFTLCQLVLIKMEHSNFFNHVLSRYLPEHTLLAVELQEDPVLFARKNFPKLSLHSIKLLAQHEPRLFKEALLPNLTKEQLNSILKQETAEGGGEKFFVSAVLPFLKTQQLDRLIDGIPSSWALIFEMLEVTTGFSLPFPTEQQPLLNRKLADALAKDLPGLPVSETLKVAFFKALYSHGNPESHKALCSGVAEGIARNLIELSEVFNRKAVHTARAKHRKMGALLAHLKRWDTLLVQLDPDHLLTATDFRSEKNLQHLLERVQQLLLGSGATAFEAHLPEAAVLHQAYAAVEKSATDQIQRQFSTHLERLKQKKEAATQLDARKKTRPEKQDQYVALESVNLSQPGKKFYFFRGKGQYRIDLAGKKQAVPVIVGPSRQGKAFPSNGGRYKKLEYKDERSVSLIPTDSKKVFDVSKERSNWQVFEGLKTMRWARVVEQSRAVAPNAGTPLIELVQHSKSAPLSLANFKAAAADLKVLHEQRGSALGDIKPENMAWRQPNVNFIDLDDRLIKTEEIGDYSGTYTSFYLPLSLQYTKVKAMVMRDMKTLFTATVTADEYAFLLTAIYSTAQGNGTMSAQQLRGFIAMGADGGEFILTGEKYSKFNSVQQVESWIRQHVKPDYQQPIRELLVNPRGRFEQRLKGECIHLTDMLNF